MNNPTVAQTLNDKNLRADFPKMSDTAFDFAVRLATFVGQQMIGFEVEDLEAPKKVEYFVPFAAMRRAAPRQVLLDLTLTGPKLMDFMCVITEVSGLAVTQTNDGLWFFDLKSKIVDGSKLKHSYFAERLAQIVDSTTISQFGVDEDEADEDGSDW